MTKEEYIKKARALGHTENMIKETIKEHEEAEKEGINMSWEMELVELPVD